MILTTLTLTLLAAPLPQTVEEPAPELPPGAAALIGDEVVSMDEYLAYLLRVSGRGPLRELVRQRLLEREAARLGLSVSEETLDAEVESFWQTLLVRHRGDEAAAREELVREGHDPDDYLGLYRSRRRSELLSEAICKTTRTIGEEEVQQRFEQEYGVGGVRTRIRHVYFNAARLRRDLERAGEPLAELAPEAVEARLRARAEDVARRLRAGEDFETVARAESHDLSVHQNGGEIPAYNYRRYGPELAAAVRAAEVGEIFGPVRTQTGLHVGEVLARETTRLEDVRAEIVAALRDAPASATEQRDLESRLRAGVRIVTF